MAYLSVFCRLLIGGLFLVSAFAKLRDPRSFREDLRGYRLVPRRAETVVMAGVVGVESLLPILLVFEVTALFGWLLAAGMLLGFATAMGSVLRRGLATGCGCLGRRDSIVRPAHVWRNLALAGVCAIGALTLSGADRTIEPGIVAVLSVAAGCVVATLVFFDDMLALLLEYPGRNG